MENYYIIEHQIRPDGMVNVSEVSRSSYALALSYYHERISKMLVNTEFVLVSVMLVNAKLEMLSRDEIQTQYVPPKQEPIEEEVVEEIVKEEI